MASKTQKTANPTLGVVIALVIIVGIGLATYALVQQFKSDEEMSESPTQIEEVQKTDVLPQATSTSETETIPSAATGTVSVNVSRSTDPVVFPDLGPDIRVTRDVVSFPFTSRALAERAQGCGTSKTSSYWDAISNQYQNATGTRLTFSYLPPHEGGDYYVVVMPNRSAFQTVAQFKQVFNACEPGAGELGPLLVSPSWLVFGSSCGPGAAINENLPDGCVLMQQKIEKGLSVK